MAVPEHTLFGDKLHQLAQGIIGQQQAAQQLQLQFAQFEQRTKEQDKVFALQKEQFALQEKNFELQQMQEARLGLTAEANIALTEAQTEKLQRELSTPLGSTGSDLKDSTILSLREEVFSEMEALDVNSVVDKTIGSLANAKPVEGGPRPQIIASRFPRFSSVAKYNQFRSEIATLQKQIDANVSVLDFLNSAGIKDLPLVGTASFNTEAEARSYVQDMQAGLDALRKNGFDDVERRAGTKSYPQDAVRSRLGEKLATFDPAQVSASVNNALQADAAREQFFSDLNRTAMNRAIELVTPADGNIQPLVELVKGKLMADGQTNIQAVIGLGQILTSRVGSQRAREILAQLRERIPR